MANLRTANLRMIILRTANLRRRRRHRRRHRCLRRRRDHIRLRRGCRLLWCGGYHEGSGSIVIVSTGRNGRLPLCPACLFLPSVQSKATTHKQKQQQNQSNN